MDQEQTVLLAACTEYFQQALNFNLTLYSIAKWAFILAIALAVLHMGVELYIKLQEAKRPASAEPSGVGAAALDEKPSEIIGAIIKLINALAKAPVWFFIFGLGLALVWLSRLDVPEVCIDAEAAPPQVETT